MRLIAPLALLALLAGCGDLPRPFSGRPGANALRLSQPPPSRLAVPAPTASLLTDDAAALWSQDMAEGLAAQEIPAQAGTGSRGDWTLAMAADVQGEAVVPTYTVLDPKGASKGTSQGAPVPAADWAAGKPDTLKAAAGAAVPKLVALLNAIEAQRQQSDPNSLLNRPPKIYFSGVTGAPGDGNTALARQIGIKLPNLGDLVQDSAKGADFTLRGEVKTAPGANNTLRVELQWIVDDAAGNERGRVIQLNEVPPVTVERYWGDVAVVVAQEAAGGIHEVVIQASGRTSQATPRPAAG